MTTASPSPPTADWQVVCLCAAWCGTCRDWRVPFEQAAAAHPEASFHWIDIEDEADTLGDVDVETFPTLLVAQRGVPRFFGPVLPSSGQFTRLLQSLAADPRAGSPVPAEAAGLLQRLQPLLLRKT
jgi:thioredoxin 1